MFRISLSVLLFSVLFLFTSASFAQSGEETHVVHVQTNKMTMNLGDDAKAFNDMLSRQSDLMNKDERVLSSRVLRHNWGADSRDLVFITEFKNLEDLFSFYNDLNSMFEKAFTKEQLDADNALYNKYVGHHADEIYREVSGTRK
jgi:hypothetical protein